MDETRNLNYNLRVSCLKKLTTVIQGIEQ